MSGNQQTLSTTLRQEQQLSARQLQSLELLNLPLLELEERVRGLDLRPASRRELHLIGVACLAEHGARLEGAVFFKKEIHECVALHPLWANE